jgi:hypothetical protein
MCLEEHVDYHLNRHMADWRNFPPNWFEGNSIHYQVMPKDTLREKKKIACTDLDQELY